MQQKLRDLSSYLFIVFGFLLPFSIAIGNIMALLIVLLWLASGGHRKEWEELRRNPVVLAVMAFFLLQVVGLLWTENTAGGAHIIAKHALLLLLPIFMLVVRKEHIRYSLLAFVAAMAMQVVMSFGIWFHILPPSQYGGYVDPVPFMGHISYNPYLTIATYVLLYFMLFDKAVSRSRKLLYGVAVAAFMIDMFITQGRAGQVMFFAMIVVVLFQYFHRKALIAALISVIALPVFFFVAYQTSEGFKTRVDEVVSEVQNYEENKGGSVGVRITFALNSLEIIREHPIAGVGTGDFTDEYAMVSARNSDDPGPTTNPHNMYVLETVQFGVIGLVSLLSILIAQLYQALRSDDHLQRSLGVAIPLLFGVIMLSDSYLRGYFTTMLFVYFSAFVYKDFGSRESVGG